jgi:hypothetical protein
MNNNRTHDKAKSVADYTAAEGCTLPCSAQFKGYITKDTVPVNVDAIIFWHVHDAEKAALAITNYREAIDRVAQTSLREMIGSSILAALLQAVIPELRLLASRICTISMPCTHSASAIIER